MDFFLSSALLKYEIWLLVLSVWYIIFHIFYDIVAFFVRIKNIIAPARKPINMDEGAMSETEDVISEATVEAKEEETKEEIATSAPVVEPTIEKKDMPEALTKEEKENITELVKGIKIKLSRGETAEARARIVEGLSIDKFNKDLNCLLASMYEAEKDYKKAELIYKDIIVFHESDLELYLKLWFVLSVQKKYEIAYEIYKKWLTFDEGNTESIEMLANLGFELERFEESKQYAKMFLKKYPRNYDMLHLLAVSLMHLEEREEALDILKKIKTIDPYNSKIQDMIDKVNLEIEMQKNFEPDEK